MLVDDETKLEAVCVDCVLEVRVDETLEDEWVLLECRVDEE